jgi:hypothetical protein
VNLPCCGRTVPVQRRVFASPPVPPPSPLTETPEVSTSPMEDARGIFYRIYGHSELSDRINDMLEQLDFHPLSVTLPATVAQYNKWNASRLDEGWKRQRTGVLRLQHSGSLPPTIELSLTSPIFRELDPDALGLLRVVAFFCIHLRLYLDSNLNLDRTSKPKDQYFK